MVKLSYRLSVIADKVPEGARLADIGTDHALLPTFLMQCGKIRHAVAGEANEGPFKAARKQVAEAGLSGQISVRFGDGLQVMESGEADVITIAGMGGSLIVKILNEGIDRLRGVRRLVLQPNVAEEQVRKWLLYHDWVVAEEEILEEDGQIYEVIVALRDPDGKRHNAELYAERRLGSQLVVEREHLLRFGPCLLRHPSAPFFAKWETELAKMRLVLDGLKRSNQEAARQRELKLQRELEFTEEVLRCLRKDKR